VLPESVVPPAAVAPPGDSPPAVATPTIAPPAADGSTPAEAVAPVDVAPASSFSFVSLVSLVSFADVVVIQSSCC